MDIAINLSLWRLLEAIPTWAGSGEGELGLGWLGTNESKPSIDAGVPGVKRSGLSYLDRSRSTPQKTAIWTTDWLELGYPYPYPYPYAGRGDEWRSDVFPRRLPDATSSH